MKYIIISTFLLLCSCNEQHIPGTVSERAITVVDTLIANKSVKDIYSGPSRQFLRLVQQIDTAGYTWDTTQIKKVTSYFRIDSITQVDNYVFYKMNFMYHLILNHDYSMQNSTEPLELQKIIGKYFANTTSIFGYYYRQKSKTGRIVDGYIEEWLFPTVEDARNAVLRAGWLQYHIYTNTVFSSCQIENRIYIFYTCDWGFRGPMQKFFNRFVKDNKAAVPSKEEKQAACARAAT